ncbi:hypothetical protein Cgig2_030717 [Carnegiea gigantea]|uniref:Aminotransferase-like plant mobile domain-containing protein n=1 Tax=Carnegiea gigantea TaxID=171969 RepID=A0A9Q1K7A6_9CARY|nr:hypothetical protein Cgig2_030717 [Carnegiea gigantea]
MSKGKVGSDDDEVSEFGEDVYGGRQEDKDRKGKDNREGKRLNAAASIGVWGDGNRKAFDARADQVMGSTEESFQHYRSGGIGTKVKLDGEEVSTEVGSKENAEEDRVGIWLRLYAFIVLSGVFFPRTPCKAAWSLLHYVDDVDSMGQYAWAEAIWQVVVESIEDMQRKLARGPLSEVQLNGLCLLIQIWFYEHTTRFSDQDGEQFPRIASWRKVDHGGMYNVTELLAELEESEFRGAINEGFHIILNNQLPLFLSGLSVVSNDSHSFDERLRHVREAYALEKEANRRIRAGFALMKERLLQLEECLQEFGAGNGDAGQGAEAVGGATFSGATLTKGTGKPSYLSGAATQDPSPPPNNVNVNLSADTEVRRTCNEDVLQEVNSIYTECRRVDCRGCQFRALTTDSVLVSDGDAGMGEKPPIAGDGGHCVADMGTSTRTHAGDDQSYPRSSNIMSRMKKAPRLQKPSRVRGSPYTNPTRGMKGGRKGLKSTATVNTGSSHCSPLTVHGDVVNDEDVISVVLIAVVPVEGEVDAHAVPDVAVKVVKAYLTWTLSPAELDLLAAVHARCKGVKDDQWNFDLPEASEKHVNAKFLKVLINVVPTRGAANRPGRSRFWYGQCNTTYDVFPYFCLHYSSGHDCGVYMLMFMDLLSVRADGLYFGQPYVRQARDKLLLSLLHGSVAHFPQAFLQGT